MKHIVSQQWLFEHGTDDHVVIVDCRFTLGNSAAGRASYDIDHIPGAFYFDLENDLSGALQQHGGRHPLPDVQELAAKLGNAGINDDSIVIVYDDQGGTMASRFWWMLTFLGHDKVYVLDGGYSKWKEAGYPVMEEPPVEQPRAFKPRVRSDMLLNVEQVKQRIGRVGTILIDSREEKRYLGLEEPIDKIAGHIPGAKNRFWKDSLTADGSWKTPASQKERFADLQQADEIIVYCGSGVTACPNVIALREAGLNNVKLYSGSWSDWISYEDNPIAKGEE